MPATFQSPIAQVARNGLSNVFVSGDAEGTQLALVGQYIDANGSPVDRQAVQMTPAAFFTAMNAATGSWKNRLYTVYLAQIGQASATVS